MQGVSVWASRRMSKPLVLLRFSTNLVAYLSSTSASTNSPPSLPSAASSSLNLFIAPWSTIQCRGIKVSASDVRVGNIIEKQGRIFEVLKVDHSHEGRGKATIKVELRDIGQGNKGYEMKVKVQFYDDKPLSASVPKRVTCTVKEGIAATPRNKKVVLDNGLTVEVPPHIVAGDAIVVNTEDDTYIERAKA